MPQFSKECEKQRRAKLLLWKTLFSPSAKGNPKIRGGSLLFPFTFGGRDDAAPPPALLEGREGEEGKKAGAFFIDNDRRPF